MPVSQDGRLNKIVRRRRLESDDAGPSGSSSRSTVDLCSVLRSIPLPDVIALVWGHLGHHERRSLRSTCSELRSICDSCVHQTTCVLLAGTSPARQHLSQASEKHLLRFPRLRTVELSKGKERARPNSLFTSTSLRSLWSNLLELKLTGFSGPGATLKLPRTFQCLKTLTLSSIDIDVGSIASLAQVPTLSSLLMKNVTFKRSAVLTELGSIRSITCLEMDECVCQGFCLDMACLGGLTNCETMDITHMDDMTGGSHWRRSLGPALSTLTSLRSIRLDASEYGVVVETEEQLSREVQMACNRNLTPITALKCLESLAMDFLLTDDGWRAAAQLPNLRDLIVEGVSLSEPMPGVMSRLEEITLNKVTPSQLVKLLPLPSLRRLHIIFINVTANTLEDLDAVADNLLRCSELLMVPVHQRQRQQQQSEAAGPSATQTAEAGPSTAQGWGPAEPVVQGQGAMQVGPPAHQPTQLQQQQQGGAVPLVQAGHPPIQLPAAAVAQGPAGNQLVVAGQQQQQQPAAPVGDCCGLEIWAGLQLVAENTMGNGNEPVMFMSKQIGSGRLACSLQPIASILKTLCLQCMAVTCRDAADILTSLPHLQDLVLMSCALEPLVLQQMHRVDCSFYRLSLLYGCSWITAAQVSAFCIAASSSRILAAASGLALSPVLELEISSDSMPWDEQLEAQRVLTPYAELLARGRVRLLFVADRDLTSAAAAAVGGQAGAGAGAGLAGGDVDGQLMLPAAPAAVIIGAQEPLPLLPAP